MSENTFREGTRIYITGSCEGLNELSEALERHPEIQLVGRSQTVREGAGALAGGHLQAVLHATRASELPEDDLAAIREYTRSPIVLLASGEASMLLDAALDADVADVLLLPQLPENVVFAIRKASHTGRNGTAGAEGRVLTVFSPKGGTGKTVMATNLASWFAKKGNKKTLLLDLDALGLPLDNIEGMAFGPDLPDGRRSLLLVSDNNFSPAAFTQFLLFAVG